jgi:hypothetical protein
LRREQSLAKSTAWKVHSESCSVLVGSSPSICTSYLDRSRLGRSTVQTSQLRHFVALFALHPADKKKKFGVQMLGDDKRRSAPHQPRQASPCPGASLTRDMLRFPTQWVCACRITQSSVNTAWSVDDAGTSHAAIWQSGLIPTICQSRQNSGNSFLHQERHP